MAEPRHASTSPRHASGPTLWDWPGGAQDGFRERPHAVTEHQDAPIAPDPTLIQLPVDELVVEEGSAREQSDRAVVDRAAEDNPADHPVEDGPVEHSPIEQALQVVERSLVDMAANETRPIPDELPRSFRMRRFGDTDLTVFPLILGASTFGWTAGADATTGILDAYLEAGGNAIDTADSYSAGRSETLIGTWLREKGARDRVVLSTKIARGSENTGLSGKSILRAAEASLGRLGVDYLDILYFSLDDPAVPLEESLTAADALLRSGKVRYLAASDFRADRLMEARILAGQLDLPRFAALQAQYSLVHREEFERHLLPVARAQQLATVPYYSLASGFLTGKYRGRAKGERGSEAHSRAARAARYATKRGFRVLDALEDVAEEQRTSMTTVALAWLLTKPMVTAPVVSASRPEQLPEILAATRLHLTRHQVALLDRVSAA